MKASNYNFFVPLDEDIDENYIAYNAKTGALAIIDKKQYEGVIRFINAEATIHDYELEEDLKYGGFIVGDHENELDALRYNSQICRYHSSVMNLIIAPTFDCNFACIYCFEKDVIKSESKMSFEIQDKLVDFINKNAKGLTKLNVNWYGGEPLAAFDVITSLSARIIQLCAENNIEYSSEMITNGYMLNKDVLSRIKELCISSIQITLDGTKEIHDARRPLKGGLPTFDTIVNNLRLCKDYLDYKVMLRINIDKDNECEVSKINRLLEENGLHEVVLPYLGIVTNSNDCTPESACYSVAEASDLMLYYNTQNQEISNKSFPKQKGNYCCADRYADFVVAPDGKLYKCFNDIGIDKYAVGDLTNESYSNTSFEYSYMLYDPTKDKKCTACKLLPICMGGCPRKRILNEGERCIIEKYNFENYLKSVAKNMLAQEEVA